MTPPEGVANFPPSLFSPDGGGGGIKTGLTGPDEASFPFHGMRTPVPTPMARPVANNMEGPMLGIAQVSASGV